MTQLKNATLRDVCTLVTDGTHDTPKTLDSGVPFIKAKQINDGIIEFADCEFISYEDHLKVISRSKPEKGDTLFAHIGASLGEAAYVNTDSEFSIKNVALFKPDPNKIVPRYLYYLVINNEFQDGIKNRRTGSAQPFVSLDILRTNPIRFINDIPTQQRIADILSAYDDLIENNTRRIRILEQMAQAIYQEWFGKVDKESPPVGWETTTIANAFEILGGSTPSTKNPEYWEDGDINWFSPSDLTANKAMFIHSSSKQITQKGLKNSSAKMFPPYCVMMTSRATIGVVSINTTEACTNQGFITCIPNERVSLYQIYFWILANFEKIDNVASGATYKEIGRGEFREFDFIVPDKKTKNKFDEIMSPIGKQIEVLLAKNANLRQTRDLLLSPLVSGEIELK